MGKVTTLTSKGQVTIPKEVREELGLEPFDMIEIVADGEGGARLRKARPSLRELMGSLPLIGVSVEEAMEQAKDERAEEYARNYSPDRR